MGGVSLLLASITLFMKLCSYAHVHHDLRVATSESSRVVDLDDKLARFYPWKCRMLPVVEVNAVTDNSSGITLGSTE